MPEPLDVVVVVGSLRAGSWNRRVGQLLAVRAPSGVSVELVELRDIPPYDNDLELEGEPAAVADFKTRLAAADGVIISTPQYNAGISGVVKNALDWASRPLFAGPLADKPATIVAASPSRNEPLRAAAQARETTWACGAKLAPEPDLTIAGVGHHVDEETGEFDAETSGRAEAFMATFVEFIRTSAAAAEEVA
jgi:chromate reductase